MNGYGTRDPTFGGGAYGRQAPDGLAGIAVPLLDKGRVHGVANIIWAKAACTIDDMDQASQVSFLSVLKIPLRVNITTGTL